MGGLWPVFGLLVLTVEWVVLRRVAPRLRAVPVGLRVLVGAGAGVGMSLAVAGLGLLVALIATVLGLSDDARQIAAAASSVMFVTGFLFVPVAAAFGAILLAVERYRVAPDPEHQVRAD